MNGEGLYMFAIMPPVDLTREIEGIRNEFAQKYRCQAALKPPVHITLIPPFTASQEQIDQIIEPLTEFTRLQIPFPVTLKDYDAFRRNEVVFIKVVNDDLLNLFQNDLEKKLRTHLPDVALKSYQEYHPHITIGYRDIPHELFDEAVATYAAKDFFATFVVDAIHLWKHNGNNWAVAETFNMGTMGMYQ